MSHLVSGLIPGASFRDVAASLLSIDQASLLGVIALIIVILADTSRLIALGGDRLSASRSSQADDASGRWGERKHQQQAVHKTIRRAIWGSVGMLVIVLWGFVIAFTNQFSPDLVSECHGVTMSALIIALSLVLSAAVRSGAADVDRSA